MVDGAEGASEQLKRECAGESVDAFISLQGSPVSIDQGIHDHLGIKFLDLMDHHLEGESTQSIVGVAVLDLVEGDEAVFLLCPPDHAIDALGQHAHVAHVGEFTLQLLDEIPHQAPTHALDYPLDT